MRDLPVSRGEPVSIKEVKAVVELVVGICPDSSYHSALQDERVSQGVLKISG